MSGDESEALDSRPFTREEIEKMSSDLREEKHKIFSAVLQKQSEKAWWLYFPEIDETLIIPKSQAQWDGPDSWLLTEWIAKQKGLL